MIPPLLQHLLIKPHLLPYLVTTHRTPHNATTTLPPRDQYCRRPLFHSIQCQCQGNICVRLGGGLDVGVTRGSFDCSKLERENTGFGPEELPGGEVEVDMPMVYDLVGGVNGAFWGLAKHGPVHCVPVVQGGDADGVVYTGGEVIEEVVGAPVDRAFGRTSRFGGTNVAAFKFAGRLCWSAREEWVV